MVGAYVIVSLTIWIVARFSPREWKEMELCDDCLLKKIQEVYEEEKCEHTLMITANSDISSGIGSDNEREENSDTGGHLKKFS